MCFFFQGSITMAEINYTRRDIQGPSSDPPFFAQKTLCPNLKTRVFVKTSSKRSYSVIENERIGLVFAKTVSIISGIGLENIQESFRKAAHLRKFLAPSSSSDWLLAARRKLLNNVKLLFNNLHILRNSGNKH